VPARVRAALERGFARDPGRRYPSMDALLAALGHDPERKRRLARAVAFGVAGLSLAALAVVGALAVRARIQARRETAALEERGRVSALLAQDVEEIEWFFRTARTLPPHDLSREE